MLAPPIAFRCAGRTNRSELYLIEVSNNQAICSCQGTNWCSHIDATIVAGERHMVPEQDHATANEAARRLRGIIKQPTNWVASWRSDKVWRGLAPPRTDIAQRTRWDGRPTITFVGAGAHAPKSDYVDHAKSLGWRVTDIPNQLTTLLVISSHGRETRAGRLGDSLGLPTISHDEWAEWCYDLTNAVLDRIDDLGVRPEQSPPRPMQLRGAQ